MSNFISLNKERIRHELAMEVAKIKFAETKDVDEMAKAYKNAFEKLKNHIK